MKKHIALGLVASTLFLAGCCTTSHVTKWEYKKVYGIEQVNKWAADGWVVSGFSTFIDTTDSRTPHDTTEIYLLKRPKQ